MSLQPGTRLGNYEVLSELGAGGMGEVYKAKDLKLGREVAIKVLPQELASDSQRVRRFEQEARAASALNHPNIVTIYEIGEHEDTPYIAMEYVVGKSLREILGDGPLPNDKLIRYGTQMAEGLAKAHEAGIVHRDLKPENVIISNDGYVKILDFGLAKLLRQGVVGSEVSTLARDTTPGTILGTVGYMSPEQAKGETADFRSDQFSLGAILYEMATGRKAFERDSAAQTLTAIIEDDPDLVTLVNPEVSANTAHVIDRCLAKNPAGRYPSTWDVARGLHRVQPEVSSQLSYRRPVAAGGVLGLLAILLVMIYALPTSGVRDWIGLGEGSPGDAGAAAIDSIAVLPFDNVSNHPSEQYVADGMTDALIVRLGRVGELRVISRTTAMRYQASDLTLPLIARELGVDALVEGTVLPLGERVRVSVSLVDGNDDRTIWSESYERDFEDVLSLQAEVAESVVREIQVHVSSHEEVRLAASRSVAREAYDVFTRGRYYAARRTEEDLRRAIEYLERAVEIDPTYAEAWAGLADAYAALGFYFAPRVETYAPALVAAEKALELDDESAQAHAALGRIRFYHDWDWAGAEESYLRALELNPSYAQAVLEYSELLDAIGRPEDSEAKLEILEKIDPVQSVDGWRWHLYLTSRYSRSAALCEQILEREPDRLPVIWGLFLNWVALDQHDDAMDLLVQILTVPTENIESAYADAGFGAALESAADELARNPSYFNRGAIADFYALAGKRDDAFHWLQKSFEARDPLMVWLQVKPTLHELHDDPRFQDLVQRMDFPG